MTLNDPLSNALSKIMNGEKVGRDKCYINPSSKIIKAVLSIMHEQGYIGEIKDIKDSKGDILKVHLIGYINRCNAIKPNFNVKKGEYTKFEKRYLPAKGVGIMVVSTPCGIMTNDEAKKKGVGGKLLAYCY